MQDKLKGWKHCLINPLLLGTGEKTPSLEGWLRTTVPQPWLVTSPLLQVNTFNNKFHIIPKELPKYLRN